MKLDPLKLKPRHKWFSAASRESESWDGPYKTFEKAALATYCDSGWEEPGAVFVTQGRKLTARERDEMGAEYEWECVGREAVEVRLPNT